MRTSIALKVACLAVAGVGTFVFLIQFCDLLFDCGCEAAWAGAATHCNINVAGPPNCPWCVQDGAYGAIAFGMILTAHAGLALWPGRLSLTRIIAVFLAFPVVGAVAGVLTGWMTGYWQ